MGIGKYSMVEKTCLTLHLDFEQENRNYQPRPHYRASPPGNQQQYGGYGPSNRHDNYQDGPQRDAPPPSARDEDLDAVKPQPPPQQQQRHADPPVAERVLDKNNYNPAEIDTDAMEKARYVQLLFSIY